VLCKGLIIVTLARRFEQCVCNRLIILKWVDMVNPLVGNIKEILFKRLREDTRWLSFLVEVNHS
jgi:hypothetical protein